MKVKNTKTGKESRTNRILGSMPIQEQMLTDIIRHPLNLSKIQMVRCFRHKLRMKGLTCQMSDRAIVNWISLWMDEYY